jgi:perosamine synthetase
MISTNNINLNNKFKILRNLSFDPKKQKFIHDTLGWNYRMTSLQAAMGTAQLKKLNKFVKIKRNIGKFYNKALRDLTDIQLPVAKTNYAENIYWVYGLILKNKKYKASYYIRKLKNEGVECRPFFCPMHLQPVFQSMGLFKNSKLPISEDLFNYGFYIPCGIGIKKKELIYVVKKIKKIFK